MYKEINFKHEGVDYIVVIDLTAARIAKAKTEGTHGRGVPITSARIFNMTSYRLAQQKEKYT